MPAMKIQVKTKKNQAGKLGCLAIVGLLLLTIIVTVGATVWAIQSQLFSKNFKPVELSKTEQQTLEQKLDALGNNDTSTTSAFAAIENDAANQDINDDFKADLSAKFNTGELQPGDNGELVPESYKEDDSKRRIELTERELNSLLAKNTDLAEQLVVHLGDDVASIKLLLPLDPDFPFFGGKTLKVSGGTEVSYKNGRPEIIMQGVSVWGVPIPNAWLGGIKNIDLVQEFGGSDGFWKSLADGIEDIEVKDGKLFIQLAE